MQLKIQKLHPDAIIPSYAHPGDAGMDLRTVEDVTLAPGERASVATGLAFAIPDGYVGLVWDKSGLSHKSGLKTLGGVIDSGYRGEVRIGVVNVGAESVVLASGDKLAQLLIQKIKHPEIIEVDELDETVRGEGGFGSTGK